jgi:hypothetical protein
LFISPPKPLNISPEFTFAPDKTGGKREASETMKAILAAAGLIFVLSGANAAAQRLRH